MATGLTAAQIGELADRPHPHRARALPAPGLARGRLHGADPRCGRVRARPLALAFGAPPIAPDARTKETERDGHDQSDNPARAKRTPSGGYGMRQAVRRRADQAPLVALDHVDPARHRGRRRCWSPSWPPTASITTGRGHFTGSTPTNQSLTGLALGSLAIGVLGVLADHRRVRQRDHPLLPGRHAAPAPVPGGQGGRDRRHLPGGGRDPDLRLLLHRPGHPLGHGPMATLGQPGCCGRLCCRGPIWPCLGMFGLGLGVIIRNTAGAIAAFVGLIFLLPVLLQPLNATATRVASPPSDPGQLGGRRGAPARPALARDRVPVMVLYCAVALGSGRCCLVDVTHDAERPGDGTGRPGRRCTNACASRRW